VALAAGVMGQTVAHHLRIPGIVLLLLLGVILGPDGLDIVRPESIGTGLPMLVELAVAVILFEGGLNLRIQRLRHEAVAIRSLITIGALVTAVGATLAVRLVEGWDWSLAILFGTLVIVTGPTVITPLLRRIQVKRNVHTILEAEGVLIDPIGAIVAVVALEVVVADYGAAAGGLEVFVKLGTGVLVGAIGGLVISGLLRGRTLVPEPLQNIMALALALASFEVSNALQSESGIMAVVVAGMIVGNLTGLKQELLEFKEQLTVMLVGMLFVLLAADVRVVEVQAIGWSGLVTIALLMFVVRPLCVGASTIGSGLTWREKAFLSWLSPRGIVAAAVASFFAQSMAEHGMSGGPELRALVFMVIAVTVVVQGLTGGGVASALGVRKKQNDGFAIVGANALGRALAEILGGLGHSVVLVDRNPLEVAEAEIEDLPIVYGDATDESTLLRADVECRRGIIAVTPNAAVNLLVVQSARDIVRHEVATFVALNRGSSAARLERIEADGHHVLFGQPVDMERWNHDVLRYAAVVERWTFDPAVDQVADSAVWLEDWAGSMMLALAVTRRKQTFPVDTRTRARKGDVFFFCTLAEQSASAGQRLRDAGWVPSDDLDEVPEG
jgi:NhaP-type Na+/H+ or K+/H+ antiporter